MYTSKGSPPIRMDEQVAILVNSPFSVSLLMMHPFEPAIVIADEKDGISVWDREICQKINVFNNRSSYDTMITFSGSNALSTSRTTALSFLNEHDSALLLTGSEDGIVRIWSNYDDPEKNTLRTSWRALTGAVPATRGAGLVVDWQQEHGILLTSGDIGMIRVWDLEKEMLVQDIPSGTDDSCVTSMSHDGSGTRIIVAGCGDGSIRLFDYRTKYLAVSTFIEHKDWIVNLHIPKSDSMKLISGSESGELKFWDIKKNRKCPQRLSLDSAKAL